MLTDFRPDPEVVKPKGKSIVKKPAKKNDATSSTSKVVIVRDAFIRNDNSEPGIPLIKRVTHLIAVEDLNTEQIAKRVQDSVVKVEDILNEVNDLIS